MCKVLAGSFSFGVQKSLLGFQQRVVTCVQVLAGAVSLLCAKLVALLAGRRKVLDGDRNYGRALKKKKKKKNLGNVWWLGRVLHHFTSSTFVFVQFKRLKIQRFQGSFPKEG